MTATKTTLTVRNEAGEVIGTPPVSAKAKALWATRTGPVRSFRGDLDRWVSYHCELIQSPDWHADERRLAPTVEEFLSLTVTVSDDTRY